jgi:hypothetical protein
MITLINFNYTKSYPQVMNILSTSYEHTKPSNSNKNGGYEQFITDLL